ncbi:hypothetical protein Pla175_28360 [Pirellulimonas nuda]|uniref:Uncharacterized protein n=1 Tax=Pirellulimonas nuda TaxID=2528009 RepID=A0A518DDD2_9BACT|nr:hypothetical protein Pla175_28360 [Pirellulimonas nuda]
MSFYRAPAVPKRTGYNLVITALPLREVWNDENETVATEREADLNEGEIRDLLRLGPVQFVVAETAAPPQWVPVAEAFDFWKSEIRPHLADPAEESFDLTAFPDEYCYLATRWQWDGTEPLVVLRTFH